MTPTNGKSRFEVARELEPLVRTLRTQHVPVPESTLLIVIQVYTLLQKDPGTDTPRACEENKEPAHVAPNRTLTTARNHVR